MATTNRASLLTKTHKVLKKHYTPVAAPLDRNVLDHILFACCLENASYEKAEDVFARVQEMYFDWNEVRVTTVTELAESMGGLPDPVCAASILKHVLQSIFETYYTFDLEHLKKQNQGVSVKEMAKYRSITPFVLSYTTQQALGGHSIPIDASAFNTFEVLGIASESDRQELRIPGLERAIPKTKGAEFGSLLHQLAADFHASPHSTRVKDIFLEIAPDAKERLPKRAAKRKEQLARAPSSDKAKNPAAATAPKKSSAKKAPAKNTAAKAPPKKKTASSSAVKKSKKTAVKKAKKVKKKSATKRISKSKPR